MKFITTKTRRVSDITISETRYISPIPDFYHSLNFEDICLYNLNSKIFKTNYGENFDIKNFMDKIVSMFQKFIDLEDEDKYLHLLNNFEFNIIGKTNYSFIFTLDKDMQKKLFLMKYKTQRMSKEISMENFIGIYGTNKLRDKIYNFSYVYGFFEIPYSFNRSKNSFYKDKKNYCLFYEFIEGKEYLDFIKKSKIEDIFCCFKQIIYALALAEKEISFTHYDLNLRNIIIKEFDEEKNFPYYDNDNKLFYIKSKYLPVFIDYEISTIKYNDKYYGSRWYYYNTEYLGLEQFAIYDCIVLLYYILIITKYEKNKDKFNYFHEIYKTYFEISYNEVDNYTPHEFLSMFKKEDNNHTVYEFIEDLKLKNIF